MINILQPGEHRIILGDSLKDDAEQTHTHVGIKYNWTPQTGFHGASGTLKADGENVWLKQQKGNEHYDYSGWQPEQPDAEQLALFWDSEKSAFILEKVQASYEVNIDSGTNVTSDTIKRHARLEKPTQQESGDDNNDDQKADPKNPFDFRHFLSQAKLASGTNNAGGKTPVPGARTPMNGVSSPLLGAARFRSPQLGPAQITNDVPSQKSGLQGRGAQKAKKPVSRPAVSRRPLTSDRPKPPSQTQASQALSSEKVIDSDSSDDEQPAQPSSKPLKTHHRNTSNISISVTEHNDDNGLLIVGGDSPPRSVPKSGYKIDKSAFRSTQGTPKLGSSTVRTSHASEDVDMPDVDDIELERILEADNNDDVEEIELEPEKTPEPVRPSLKELKAARRRQSASAKKQKVKEPTPPPAMKQQDSIDEDEIARELERELAEDADNDDGGVGLGISEQAANEESDVSEEE